MAGVSLRLRRAAETLGPTYIKLGQIISSGEGIFQEVIGNWMLLDQWQDLRPHAIVVFSTHLMESSRSRVYNGCRCRIGKKLLLCQVENKCHFCFRDR